MIYLDSASTTPIKQEVLDVIIDAMRNYWGNPSSIYEFGLESKRIIENARRIVADSINAEPDEIIFTSGASESNALAIDGFLKANENTYFVTSNVEHSSIPSFKANNLVYVNGSGLVLSHKLDAKLSNVTNANKLVSIIAANNEIGTINDINGLSEIVHKYGAVFHIDATQYYPYFKIDVKSMRIDMMSVSGHKFGCPKGIGFLYVKNGIKLNPIIYGTQNGSKRGGTENVPYIAGLAKAVELLDYSQVKSLQEKRDYCLNKICQIKSITNVPAIYLNGSIKHRLPNNINIQIKDVDAQMLIALLDLNGVCVSAGSACHAGDKEPSRVLKAIGLSDKEARESIRISLSEDTTYDEIDKFVGILEMILTQLAS